MVPKWFKKAVWGLALVSLFCFFVLFLFFWGGGGDRQQEDREKASGKRDDVARHEGNWER